MFQNFDRTASRDTTAPRVAALRERLTALGVDGMVVPRADAHQGETVAPRDERLAWLTGFTGSAGMAIVLADRGALFVDGRYTLQAADQTDTGMLEVVATHETKPEEWLENSARKGATIGYDPWLHGKAEIERLRQAAEKVGATLAALSANPVDEVWEDQPSPPMGAVEIQPSDLAGESAAEKRQRVAARLRAADASALVLTQPDNIAWLLNIRGGDLSHSPVALGFAVLTEDAAVELIMEPDKFNGDALAHLGNGVSVTPPTEFGEALDRLAGRKVILDEVTCPLWVASRLEAAGAEPVWSSDPTTALKAVKNEAELAGTRAAHLRDGAAMVRFLSWLETAVGEGRALTEIDVVEALEGFRRETGALMDISFDTICGSGPNGAIVHYRVTRETNRTLQAGELLLVDSGGQYRDGTTDITRTVAVGEIPADTRRPFTLVLKGLISVSTARWPAGQTGRDIDTLARQHLWRAGLDYDHGTGHGVGVYLNVHEGPASLSRRGGKVALEPGMILSNEPGYYRPGKFGIRSENLVIVTPPDTPEGGERPMLGFETLTLCPFELRLVDAALLDDGERAWLDRYHARVAEALGPLVDGTAAEWLERATRPIGTA